MAKTSTRVTCVGMLAVPMLLASTLWGQVQEAEKPAVGKEVRTYYDPKRDKLMGGTVTSIAFSPDGKSVASADISPTVKIWEASTGKLLVAIWGPQIGGVSALSPFKETLGQLPDTVQHITFHPDGKQLAGCGRGKNGAGGDVRVWDATTGKAILTLKHPERLQSVAFSPDGKTLAAGTLDERVKVWDAATGKELLTIDHPANKIVGILSVAFSPDGKQLASAGKEVKIWDAATGKELRSLKKEGYVCWSLA